ncbi:ATP-binding cassette sub-family G member 5-like [Mytilus galloprovincialis]|uniref:ATP-binding cassette sub-family G member 5-like n=1 Tax=Mytilus galloprovincialis TaxID=29158 RepID=UPI003F7C147D
MSDNPCFSYFNGCGNILDPDEDEEQIVPTLNLLNINYDIKQYVGPWWKGACFRKRQTKTVLSNINVQFKSGEMTAILGSSGSGKTSLLDVISSRYTGKLYGKVYFNNYLCTADIIKQYAAYVMQADRLLHNLTVRETLKYSGILRLPGAYNDKEINAEVNRVIADMGLKHVADSKIGGSVIRGISGGERRRVTIAIQLLQNPKILLLDEPTTGLDSCTTRHLVSSLSDIAHNGKIVIMTIHQPRSDVFKLFDNIGLLSMGEIVYFGKANQMVEYFGELGYPCPTYANPLDHYVDLASIDRRDRDLEVRTFAKVENLIMTYTNSTIKREMVQSIEKETMRPTTRRTMLHLDRPHPPIVFTVMLCLIRRMMVNLRRDRSIYLSRILLLTMYVPFILAFLGRLKDNQESIQDRMGLLYQSTNVPLFVAVLVPVAVFPPIRDLYYRECRDGLYSTTTFVLSYIIHMIPFHAVASLIFSLIVYWVTGLYPSWERFGIYYADVFAMHFSGEIMTIGIMGVFYSAQVSQSVASLVISATTLFSSGFIRTLPDILPMFQWLSWGVVMKYSAEIVVANEFHNLNISCNANKEGVPCLYPNGNMYLDDFYPDSWENLERNFYALGGFIVLFTVLTITAFKIRGIPNLH